MAPRPEAEAPSLTRANGFRCVPPAEASVEDVLLAVGEKVGCDQIHSASRMNKAVVVFLRDARDVSQIIEGGIWVLETFVPVSPLFTPATRVTISNVPPHLPDDVLVKELLRFGKLSSAVTTIPLGCRGNPLKHVLSFRRQVLMFLNSPDKTLEVSFRVPDGDLTCMVYASTDSLRCFQCGDLGHKRFACPSKEKTGPWGRRASTSAGRGGTGLGDTVDSVAQVSGAVPEVAHGVEVVGLTASVGIGSFKNQQEAEMNICRLCANLDTRVIATVTKNIDELRSYVHIPEKEFYEVPASPITDPFIRIIRNIMCNIERLAKNIYDIDTLSPILNRDYGSQKYEQWIVDVQKRCKLLQLSDPEQERRVCRALFNYTEHLRKYNDALIINEDARTKDALDYLQAFIEQVRKAGYDSTERTLTAFFDVQREQLLRLATEGQENPKLQELKFILEEEYRNNDQTRTLLFVRTRALADALKKWIDETDSLKFLNPGVLIGRGRKSSQLVGSGMTLTSQKGVLDSFKTSDHIKILIATSVADEGIDIPQCNLVLMYEYVGNVVKMVQVRGRGRAVGSRCFLISSRTERIEKEKQNMEREKIVEKAIISLQASPEKLQAQVRLFQREDKVRRDCESRSVERRRVEGSYKLLCAKCEAFACVSEDLRVLKESHHVILDHSVFQRCVTQPHHNPRSFGGISKTQKLLCADCKLDWGIVATYLHIKDLPIVKIESFVVQDVTTQRKLHFRKWREVTFAMREFELTEITPETWGARE